MPAPNETRMGGSVITLESPADTRLARRGPLIADVAAAIVLAAALGWILSHATTRVVNWFVMTDELFYERLGISIAHTGSLVPRYRGEVVGNVNQLYPLLISPFYGNADVPHSLVDAHRLNAFLMASAVIPVFLLARHVGLGRITSLWVGGLAVAGPWCVLSSFLLTESVAYPAFCWSILALVAATHRASTAWDAVALASIGLAVAARTQFVVLLLVLPVAVVVVAGGVRPVLRSRRLLVAVYALLLVVFLAGIATGRTGDALGNYSVTTTGIHIDAGLFSLAVGQAAILALATGIVPFLVGAAWLCDRLQRAAPERERALGAVGVATLVLLGLEVASFNQRFGGGQVKDRYLFYVLPLVLVGVGAVVSCRRWPARWAWIGPVGIVLIGLGTVALPTYVKLNVDSPSAIFDDEILRLATTERWAHLLIPLALVVALAVLYTLHVWVSPAVAVAAVAVLVTVTLPGGAAYAFDRLFAVDGTNGLPITLDQGGVFNWIDRALGKNGRVTMITYPVNSPDYWAGVAYWWDAEFWNETVVDKARFVSSQPNDLAWLPAFDRQTGALRATVTTPDALFFGEDVRFRLAGKQVAADRGSYVFRLDRPLRADWVTDRIYGDGWTLPHVPARIRVYARPGQQTPLIRYLTISVKTPDGGPVRSVAISSNQGSSLASIEPSQSVDRGISVCVPPRGSAVVQVQTDFVSDIYRDPTRAPLTGETDRPAGVHLRGVVLADETKAVAHCH
jgi:hypothetical protein